MKSYIVCQSRRKSDIASDLEQLTFPCMEALAQLYLFPQYETYHHHWSQEVWNHFKRVDKIKPRNKIPTANFIYENTWIQNDDCVQVAIDSAIYHESELVPDENRLSNFDLLYDTMESYFIWVAETLSRSGKIQLSQVQVKLNELDLI